MKRNTPHTTPSDPMFQWFSDFESDQPSEGVEKQAMNRILEEWTRQPVIDHSAYSREYWWIYILGSLLILSAIFWPEPLGLQLQTTQQSLQQLIQQAELLLQKSIIFAHPATWLVALAGMFLYAADALLGKRVSR